MSKRRKLGLLCLLSWHCPTNDTITLQKIVTHFPKVVAKMIEQYILPLGFQANCLDFAYSGHYELTRKHVRKYFAKNSISRTIYSWAINPMSHPDYIYIWNHQKDFMFEDIIHMAACFENFAMIEHLLKQKSQREIWELTDIAYLTNQWKLIEIILDNTEENPEDKNLSNEERALMIGCRNADDPIVRMCLLRINHFNRIWEKALGIACKENYSVIIHIISTAISNDFHCGYCYLGFANHCQ